MHLSGLYFNLYLSMKKLYWLLGCCLTALYVNAQKHDYNWVFGYGEPSAEFGGGLIDFNEVPTAARAYNLGMSVDGQAAACSDSVGRLLFYTNGLRIFNRNRRLIQFGDTINPGPLWIRLNQNPGVYLNYFGAQCIPAPGRRNCYYLFHHAYKLGQGNTLLNTPLYYTLIDMGANGGEGKVLEKNRIMIEGDLIQLALTKHANGRDWWLLVAQQSEHIYTRFLISDQGVSVPIQQYTGFNFSKPELASLCLFSPDGTRYLRGDAENGCHLFDFNRCTGELSNYLLLPEREAEGIFRMGASVFSPDSRFLYCNQPGQIVQFDLEAPDLGYYSIDTVQRFDLFTYPFDFFPVGFDWPQLGPDGKIYYSASSSTRWMHIMHRPNLPGIACEVQNHALFLPRYNDLTICFFPNYRLGVWEGSPCDTLPKRPSGGFSNTSYELFLERQAKAVHNQPVSVGKSPSVKEKQTPGPYDLKAITLERMRRLGIISSSSSDIRYD